VLPPPTCTAPVELSTQLPLPATPAVAPTVEPPAVADGAVWRPLTCAAPVEPDALLPPPTCAAPVELVAVLSPPPTRTGAPTLAEVERRATRAVGWIAVGATWTTPVEPDALLPPSLELEVEPLGADAVVVPAPVATLTAGLTETEPTWTTPVELVASLPAFASAGSAPATTALEPTASASATDLMGSPLVPQAGESTARTSSTYEGVTTTSTCSGTAAAVTPSPQGQ
jgi:hypothetical protein